MVDRWPRLERLERVVVDNGRCSVDGCDSGAAVRRRPRDIPILESGFPEPTVMTKSQLKTIMSDREKLLKQWRNLPANDRVTWETFKRQQRPKIVRQSRPDDWKASRKSSVTHPRTFSAWTCWIKTLRFTTTCTKSAWVLGKEVWWLTTSVQSC